MLKQPCILRSMTSLKMSRLSDPRGSVSLRYVAEKAPEKSPADFGKEPNMLWK